MYILCFMFFEADQACRRVLEAHNATTEQVACPDDVKNFFTTYGIIMGYTGVLHPFRNSANTTHTAHHSLRYPVLP